MASSTIDAFHLPGLGASGELDSRTYGDSAVELRWPRLAPEDVRSIAAALLDARARTLAEASVGQVVATIDRVAARLADRADPIRRTAESALPAVTGYHPTMVSLVLDRMASDWRAPALELLLEAELGGRATLEGFVAAAKGFRTRAYGPRLAFHVFAGNVPGVAVTALVRSLLVRAATLGKTASGEPVLAPLFARAVAEEWPELGECIAVTYWPGGAETLEAEALQAADVAVVYGGRAATAGVRARAPRHVRLLEHGPRISFAAIARDALHTAAGLANVAHSAARAVALFDQQGCVSPQLIYVEEGGNAADPRAFARALADALETVESELPRGRLTAAESAAIHDVRATAEFRAIGGGTLELYADRATSHTVIFDPDPVFEGSCLNRVVRVKPILSLDAIPAIIGPFRDVLQSAALEAGPDRRTAVAAALGDAGVTRVTTLDRLPWPPPHGHHDGRGPLRELVRWVDLEY